MVVTLENAKKWLKVETTDEDALIVSCIAAAEDIVAGILRQPLTNFEEMPELVRQAVHYAIAQFYELREDLVVETLVDNIKRLLFAYRTESW